jgi:multisubunit Na+/H+ antiporter MnhB subunit
MKLWNLLSHPYLVITGFCAILISGEHWGGFYLTYVLLALPNGGLHALFAFAGILILLVSYHRFSANASLSFFLNLAGVLLMVASLFYFFRADPQHYNQATFQQWIPLCSLAFAAMSGGCLLLRTLGRFLAGCKPIV